MAEFRPLEGVRVLAFETAASLPAGTRGLADLGAEVVRVAEPPMFLSPYIRVWDTTLSNKHPIALDLKHDEGRALALRLCDQADVVCCNFRPRVMRRFGLDYESLRGRKPDIIVLQLSGYGTPGPWEEFPAYGPSVEAAGGMNAAMGAEDEMPQRVGGGVFADTLAGRYAAFAIAAALVHRDATGEGQHLDLSMYESIVTGIGDRIVRAAAEGAPPRRLGNRDERYAPQGVYPAAGRDQWIAISVTTDEEWQALVRLAGDPRLEAPRYAAVEGRQAGHDAIDDALAGWTREHEKARLAALLQEHGVSAAPVNWPGDIPYDEQMVARGAFTTVHHAEPIVGYRSHPHLTMPARAAGYDRGSISDHRAEGSRSAEVLRRWIGASDAEIAAWRESGAVLPERPVLPPGSENAEWFGSRFAPRDPDYARRLGLQPPEAAS